MQLERRLKVLTPESSQPTVKVAFASTDLRHVDQHFGAATGFAIYQVSSHSARFVEVIRFATQAMDGNEGKLAEKITALEGCIAVYCQAIGASAIARLRASGIQPLKVAAGSALKPLLADLQADLANGTSAWLTRAVARQQLLSEDRFALMEAEGWCE